MHIHPNTWKTFLVFLFFLSSAPSIRAAPPWKRRPARPSYAAARSPYVVAAASRSSAAIISSNVLPEKSHAEAELVSPNVAAGSPDVPAAPSAAIASSHVPAGLSHAEAEPSGATAGSNVAAGSSNAPAGPSSEAKDPRVIVEGNTYKVKRDRLEFGDVIVLRAPDNDKLKPHPAVFIGYTKHRWPVALYVTTNPDHIPDEQKVEYTEYAKYSGAGGSVVICPLLANVDEAGRVSLWKDGDPTISVRDRKPVHLDPKNVEKLREVLVERGYSNLDRAISFRELLARNSAVFLTKSKGASRHWGRQEPPVHAI